MKSGVLYCTVGCGITFCAMVQYSLVFFAVVVCCTLNNISTENMKEFSDW